MAQPGKGQGPGPAAQAMPPKSDPSKEEEELEQALKHLKLLHIRVGTYRPSPHRIFEASSKPTREVVIDLRIP